MDTTHTKPVRPTIDEYYMNLAGGVASRSTCVRRQVGCLITDADGRLLASGYNGVPRGIEHCTDVPCEGASDEAGNTSRCLAIHAEDNALMQAGDRLNQAWTLYSTTLPCFQCAKKILNTGITRVVYRDEYADQRAVDLFIRGQVKLVKLP